MLKFIATVPRSTISTFPSLLFFFFNDPATTEIYTLSLHDALPISSRRSYILRQLQRGWLAKLVVCDVPCAALVRPRSHRAIRRYGYERGGWYIADNELRKPSPLRSEEHTSELQSLTNLVCRLLPVE